MIDFLPVEEDNATLIRQMSRPEIRIVSLTVIEGGYFMDTSPGSFDLEHGDIHHESPIRITPERHSVLSLQRSRTAGMQGASHLL